MVDLRCVILDLWFDDCNSSVKNQAKFKFRAKLKF
jgi:hypothetical protein